MKAPIRRSMVPCSQHHVIGASSDESGGSETQWSGRSPQGLRRRSMSAPSRVATRPCRLRGVPTPVSRRISSPRVEAAGVHEHALQDVGVTPQMYAAHRARLVEMGKETFQALAALAQQPLAPGPTDAPAIPVDGVTGRGLAAPVPPPPIGLREVRRGRRSPRGPPRPDCCDTPCPRPARAPRRRPAAPSRSARRP